jgi:MerR family transcriptional regulator, mercuric resistance operon regulatory protein
MTPAITSSRSPKLTIGTLSRETGVNIETIRYYERIGLIPVPPRSRGRHRLYDDLHRRRLSFIRRSRALGFSLSETRDLLGLARGHDLACAEVRSITERHVAEIRGKIRDLRALDRVLSALAAKCREGEVPPCPILDALGAGVSPLRQLRAAPSRGPASRR